MRRLRIRRILRRIVIICNRNNTINNPDAEPPNLEHVCWLYCQANRQGNYSLAGIRNIESGFYEQHVNNRQTVQVRVLGLPLPQISTGKRVATSLELHPLLHESGMRIEPQAWIRLPTLCTRIICQWCIVMIMREPNVPRTLLCARILPIPTRCTLNVLCSKHNFRKEFSAEPYTSISCPLLWATCNHRQIKSNVQLRIAACLMQWRGCAWLGSHASLYSSVAERQSCKLKVLGSIPSGGSFSWHRKPGFLYAAVGTKRQTAF